MIFVSNIPNPEPRRILGLRCWWMPHDPSMHARWFRLVRVRSPLLTESLRFLFHGLLRCFSSPGALLTSYVFRSGCHGINRDGFPHSEILGSSLWCSSPRRIVASTSFIGNLSLGIRRAPSVAYIRVTCSVPLTHRLLTTMQLSKCFRLQRAPGRARPSPVNTHDTGSLGLSQVSSRESEKPGP